MSGDTKSLRERVKDGTLQFLAPCCNRILECGTGVIATEHPHMDLVITTVDTKALCSCGRLFTMELQETARV